MATQTLPAAVLMVLAIPVLCLAAIGLYLQWLNLQWLSRQIYKRIGNYSIGESTFYGQLQYPGLNFPGPNVLEAVIAVQPADLQAHIADHRRRLRRWRRAALSYMGFLLALGSVFSVVRKMGS
jgi:hypothetical protein